MIKIKEYFKFNSRERLAIYLLTCLMSLFWILPVFYPSKSPINLSENDRKLLANQPSDAYQDSNNFHLTVPVQKLSADQNLVSKYGVVEEIKKPVHYFYFDPNTIGADQWLKLGLRNKTIQTILNYRNKGGHFYKADDLRKIWGLRPDEADLLVPYVQIQVLEKKGIDFKKEGGHNANKAFKKDSLYVQKPINRAKLNINTATQAEWELFPGIGPVLAARIIKFRDKIGGFTTVDQVGKTYGLADSIFQKIMPFLEMEGNLPLK